MLEFCLGGIFKLFRDVLIVKTPETLNDPRHFTPEELVMSYDRCCVSVLMALPFMMEHVQKSAWEKEVELLVAENAFWRRLSDVQVRIRLAGCNSCNLF